MSRRREPGDEAGPEPIDLPVEIEVYIEADGSVTFADLAAEVVPIATELNPEQPLACEAPDPRAGSHALDASDAEGEEREQDD